MTDDELELRLQALHQRLVDGDRVASAEFAELVLPVLTRRLRQAIFRLGDEAEGCSIIGRCLAVYLADPMRYTRERGSLLGWLLMDARGDLSTAYIKQRKDNKRFVIPDPDVVLERSGQKYEIELDDGVLNDEALQQVIESLTDQEREFVKLWQEGVRAAAPFAEVLGISHFALEDQHQPVKSFKDALRKKIKRRYAALNGTPK